MLVVTRYRVPAQDQVAFRDDALVALGALTDSRGCTGAHLGRSIDDPTLWTLTTTWDSVGSYRRALSGYQVKVLAVPLMYRAVDEPTAFEQLAVWTPSEGLVEHATALAADAGQVGLGQAAVPTAPRDLPSKSGEPKPR